MPEQPEPTPCQAIVPLPADVNDGKDKKTGRFLAKNKRGRGNPLNAQMQKLQHAAVKAVTPNDMRILIRKMLAAAKKGNVPAANFIGKYLLPEVPKDLNIAVRQMTEEELAARMDSLLGLETPD
jgi:hypothetical protein